MAIRDELVTQGVRFLQHPKVQDSPLSERLQFLEKKGLTPQEIAKALKLSDEQNAKRAAQAVASVTGAAAGERLRGRIGVVVGGNSGLGRLIAVRLAKEGATLVVLDDKAAAPPGASVVEQIAALDGAPAATLVEGSLHDAAFVDAAFADAAARHKRVDFVVNCVPAPAGSASAAKALHDVTDGEWDAAMNVSAKAVFLSCRRAVRLMLAQDDGAAVRGRIVNVSSLYGMRARRGHFTFGVSKSAVVQLTRQLAAEYAAHGVVCNAVAPGFIDDSLSRDDCLAPAVAGRVPAEAPGKAADVANAVLFLVSDDAQFVHGVNLLVDGGAMAT